MPDPAQSTRPCTRWWRSVLPLLLALLMAAPLRALLAQERHAVPTGSTTDPVSQAIVGVIVVGVFVLLTLEAAHRVLIAMSAVALLFLISYFTPYRLITFDGVAQALDINVLTLLASMMAVVGVLKTTGVFEWAVGRIMQLAGPRPLVLLALIMWFTAVASAFLDNVTTVVFVTPMVIAMAQRLQVRSSAFLLPMIMAANIGGTATLIGDPPNIMIGSGAGLSFVDFVEDLTLPCVLMMIWLEFYSRRYYAQDLFRPPPAARPEDEATVVIANPTLARWMAVICAAILVGFLTHHVTGMPPAVPALVGAAAALIAQDVLYLRSARPTAAERSHGILQVTERDIEWPTLSFFGFLFIVVGAAVQTGLIATAARGLEATIDASGTALGLSPNGTLILAAILICWVAGILSALIDNIPFVAVAIPIVARLIPTMSGNADVLWWALSLGACLGGNGTVIGASANVTTIGLAERDGAHVSFAQFARYAAPMAAGTLVIASAYLVLHVLLGKMGSFVAMGVLCAFALTARFAVTRRARGVLPLADGV